MINERIIYDYYVCKYKAFLKYHKTTGVGHNYEMFEQRKIEEKESFIFSKIKNGNNILDLKDTNTEQFYFEKFYELIQNVTFSNNNAEHGFTHFAIYRKQANGLFTQESIERYLSLLSLYQTCAYRNLSFLHFLRSKEKNIDNYQRKYNKNGNKKHRTSLICHRRAGHSAQSVSPDG